jgi:hypothetical protein
VENIVNGRKNQIKIREEAGYKERKKGGERKKLRETMKEQKVTK